MLDHRKIITSGERCLIRYIANRCLEESLTACMFADIGIAPMTDADALALADIAIDFFEAIRIIERTGTL